MSIGIYSGKNVIITNTEGKEFKGYVCDYFYPDENESGKESIILDCTTGAAIEFFPEDISNVTILEEE